MKERITNANLGWTALASFLLGALASLAFTHLLPEGVGTTASVMAAWAQAIFSGAAILVAAYIPSWQEKRRLKQRIDVYVDMINRADSNAQSAVNFLTICQGKMIRDSEEGEWSRLCRVFQSIPFHDVPDFRLYGLLLDAARASESIRDVYEPLITTDLVVTQSHVFEVNRQAQVLAQCYLDAVDISNSIG